VIPGNTSSQGKYVDPPTSVSASISGTTATVSFTLPVNDGKGTATYSVASSPGGLTASGSGSPLTVTGLSYSTSYTFIVTAISGYGISTASSASSAVSTGSAPVTPPVTPAPVTPAPVVPAVVCPNGHSYNGGYCYYNCGTGSLSCACGPGTPSGYVSPQGTADCYYAYP
jgi:hypothetical protein